MRTLAEKVLKLKWNGVGLVKQQEDVEFHLLKLFPASKHHLEIGLLQHFCRGKLFKECILYSSTSHKDPYLFANNHFMT